MARTVPSWVIDDALAGVWTDITLRSAYSGRGMYGRSCFGLVVDNERTMEQFWTALRDVIDAEDELSDDLLDELQDSMQTDSMGLGMIAYFPGYTLDGQSAYALEH